MGELFEHLGLTAWPFSVVPRPQYCDYLAGRPQLREDIRKLVQSLSRRDTSSIQVFWSSLGAGKTHSLYYLANQARAISAESGIQLHPIYTEFPRRARGFFDVYQAAMVSLDSSLLADAFMEATTSPGWASESRLIFDSNPDLESAFRNLVMGSTAERLTALRWLRGDSLAIGEFRRIGISQRLATADQAVRILASVIQLLDMAGRSRGHQGFRLIWIVDEFQRLSRCGPNVRSEVNSGLHSVFNACPTGLTLILSFSGPPNPKNLPSWISPELRDRIGATKVMILPPFQPSEALGFVREVMSHFRPNEFSDSRLCFPFKKEACEYVINRLNKEHDLRPRTVMQAMNAVLEAADSEIEAGKLSIIDSAFAEKALAGYVFVSDADPDDL